MKIFSHFFCNIGDMEAESHRRILQEELVDGWIDGKMGVLDSRYLASL